MESSNLIFSNSYLSARGIPTFGLYTVKVYTIIGELIKNGIMHDTVHFLYL